jgi:hypothetical protein
MDGLARFTVIVYSVCCDPHLRCPGKKLLIVIAEILESPKQTFSSASIFLEFLEEFVLICLSRFDIMLCTWF